MTAPEFEMAVGLSDDHESVTPGYCDSDVMRFRSEIMLFASTLVARYASSIAVNRSIWSTGAVIGPISGLHAEPRTWLLSANTNTWIYLPRSSLVVT
ncbi:hypothetical protein D3C84_852130 [compost metagenome]